MIITPWPVPRLTDNARLLLGFIAGRLDQVGYRVIEANPAMGTQVIEHTGTRNRYLVTVLQVSGTEYAPREESEAP